MNNLQFTIYKKILVSLFVVYCLLLVATPTPIHAQSFNLIVCQGTSEDPCTFAKLIELAKNLINALVVLSTFLATAAFAYAGLKLLTSGGNPGAKDEAKKIFRKVIIGYLWILGAWLVVYTIVSTLLKPGFYFTQ